MKKDLIRKAMRISIRAHAEQVDKGDIPYIYHPLTLMSKMTTEEAKILALLHDVIEDTSVTLEELRDEGIPEEILLALGAISRKEEESSKAYLRRVSKSKLATEVKIEDLKHNMDLSRLEEISKKDLERVAIYKERVRFLEKRRGEP